MTEASRRRGRPAFVPTDEQRKNVKILVGLGIPEEHICALVRDHGDRPIGPDTLHKYFRKEIEMGAVELNAQVGNFIISTMLGIELPAGIKPITDEKIRGSFARSRLGWKQTVRNEIGNADGKPFVYVANNPRPGFVAQAASLARAAPEKLHALGVAEALHAYINAAGIAEDRKGWLFRTARGHDGSVLSDRAMSQPDAWRTVRRRAKTAGIHAPIGNHPFRATGITTCLSNGGALEHAQEMAAYESPRRTTLYDRTKERLTQDEVKRIRL